MSRPGKVSKDKPKSIMQIKLTDFGSQTASKEANKANEPSEAPKQQSAGELHNAKEEILLRRSSYGNRIQNSLEDLKEE